MLFSLDVHGFPLRCVSLITTTYKSSEDVSEAIRQASQVSIQLETLEIMLKGIPICSMKRHTAYIN